jgi:hypothetical protein
MFIGEGTNSNRTKGGLWNTSASVTSVEKPGHIEPRRMTTGYGTGTTTNLYTAVQQGESAARNHSLSSAQMGGAAIRDDATIQKPWANPEGFFAETTNNGIRGGDTVSGKVVLRGYAEDDQRIARVVLNIGGTDVPILEFQPHAATGSGAGTNGSTDSGTSAFSPPLTGLLRVPTALAGDPAANPPVQPQVYFTDSIDAYRHRVEWAYIWNTETLPATVVGDNVTVRVISYIRDGNTNTHKTTTPSDETNAPGTAHTNASDATRPNTSPFNKEFPVGLNKYNRINFNLRPYITGFLRNKTNFSHDTRSRQGRYMFYRGETAVVTGFNLGTGTISIPGAANTATSNVGTIGDFGITTANNQRYRQFIVGTGATTGDGVVTYSYNSQNAVNTGRARAAGTPVRPAFIQPWNIEYSPGVDGSQLWDDFVQVHIWQSNDTATGNDSGRFPKGISDTNQNFLVFDPSMSIDPSTGMLWASHNEGGGGGFNSGTTKVSNNSGVRNGNPVAKFVDPIINSDIFISPRAAGYNNLNYSVWTAFSIIGRSGDTSCWDDYGGVYVSGPQGAWPDLNSGVGNGNGTNNGYKNGDVAASSHYLVESSGYNAATNTAGNANWPPGNVDFNAPSRNQFKTPHIVTEYRNNEEHIHVSYYDTKDGSLKYRYNRRNNAGEMAGHDSLVNNPNNGVNINRMPYAWTNLDGGYDLDDQNAFNGDSNGNWANGGGGGWYRAPFSGFTAAINQNGRIVNYNTRSATGAQKVDAGEYNSIALTRNGYPVIAYYDKTNQKLKMAISTSVTPIAATNWTIIDNVITLDPRVGNNPNSPVAYGTGEYVSMKIDTTKTNDIVHIAAMNAASKNLIYVKATLNGTTLTNVSVQVVDNVGSVGRWCTLSLDAQGNPWISYQDEGYQGSRDGVKLAYLNETRYYKGSSTYRNGEDKDMYGALINGWEAMHVPTAFRVDNARLGMERFPTIRNTGATRPGGGLSSFAAVGYLGQDYFRIAYYIE